MTNEHGPAATESAAESNINKYINLKLAALSMPTVGTEGNKDFQEVAGAFLSHFRETMRLLTNYLCPADQRIQNFVDRYFADVAVEEGAKPGGSVKLPGVTFVLDKAGGARAMSLPPGGDEFVSGILRSYRVKQGVLHNPKSDRRTTKGIFHVTEGGLPIPDDKEAIPKVTFARLLVAAFKPPADNLQLPFTQGQPKPAECFVSLLLRPIVCPKVPGVISQKEMEIRFFAPGALVSNLDFVESIFGNAGDPYLPENDAALDVRHWTGHTGCVILAPHLTTLTKKSVGLPHFDDATERQRRDGMCWKKETELYNGGNAFKATARDESGVIVTIIADNYYGYCKKEVKTQISFAANLFGACEEEHAGGALVFPSYDLGEEFSGNLHVPRMDQNYESMIAMHGSLMNVHPDGYAVDKQHPDIFYVSENVKFDLHAQKVSWPVTGLNGEKGEKSMRLLLGRTYVRPSGYKVHMEKPPGGRSWRLIGTVAEPTFCHKPCTVSGGGKSEISKPITDAIIAGPGFVADFDKDFDLVDSILKREYGDRFRDAERRKKESRPILSSARSLGSVIKLLTPQAREYTAEFNEWLASIPQYIKELVYVVKRFYKPSWEDKWRDHFSVDIINGRPGNELKYNNRKIVTSYLRVGYDLDGSWRTFGLRKDFFPAVKLQMEDDITASIVVAASRLPGLSKQYSNPSVKFVTNAENLLFQRPDDAIHRGYDRRTEADFAEEGSFFSNYEPLPASQAMEMVEDAIGFSEYTEPMRKLIRSVAEEHAAGKGPSYFISPANPRLVDGKPSKNPRYLQKRNDHINPRETYLAEMALRLHRSIPPDQPVHTPVNAVLPGRRNNPPEAGVRPMAVHNPVHFLEMPELFMEIICSMTGKSPSTTGAGSEGALTKGPFNALPPIIDLNNALVSCVLCEADVFMTAAGYVGPHMRVDHDISLLVPEVWCRMTVQERSPKALIRDGYLEKCEDFEHGGKTVLASRLGYRITRRFVNTYFSRVFNHPHEVLTDEMLKPELQDMDIFIDGIDNILVTQQRVARAYFDDGSVAAACPPLKALLHIMRDGNFEGMALEHPEIRKLFTREYLLQSEWYAQRLACKQRIDASVWQRHVEALEAFLVRPGYADEAERLNVRRTLARAKAALSEVQSQEYLASLQGSLGAHPLHRAGHVETPTRELAEGPLHFVET
jgi:phosphoenolpyruvate carboxykinase (diphosphate)